MKSIFLRTTLGLFIFLPAIVSAKETCHIEQFQPVDIQPEISGGVLDKESGQFLITQKPPNALRHCDLLYINNAKSHCRSDEQPF